jgi:hypothetical protein
VDFGVRKSGIDQGPNDVCNIFAVGHAFLVSMGLND